MATATAPQLCTSDRVTSRLHGVGDSRRSNGCQRTAAPSVCTPELRVARHLRLHAVDVCLHPSVVGATPAWYSNTGRAKALPFLSSPASSLVGGVGVDAKHVVETILKRNGVGVFLGYRKNLQRNLTTSFRQRYGAHVLLSGSDDLAKVDNRHTGL